MDLDNINKLNALDLGLIVQKSDFEIDFYIYDKANQIKVAEVHGSANNKVFVESAFSDLEKNKAWFKYPKICLFFFRKLILYLTFILRLYLLEKKQSLTTKKVYIMIIIYIFHDFFLFFVIIFPFSCSIIAALVF